MADDHVSTPAPDDLVSAAEARRFLDLYAAGRAATLDSLRYARTVIALRAENAAAFERGAASIADLPALLAVVKALPTCCREGCAAFALYALDGSPLCCDECLPHFVSRLRLRPSAATELPYADALRTLLAGTK